MTPEEIDIEFQKAYEKANQTTLKFPPDILLKFYAYYKQATEEGGISPSIDDKDVRNAFKLNALLQVKGLSALEAKKEYIELTRKYCTQ